jgi:hypothetical protein
VKRKTAPIDAQFDRKMDFEDVELQLVPRPGVQKAWTTCVATQGSEVTDSLAFPPLECRPVRRRCSPTLKGKDQEAVQYSSIALLIPEETKEGRKNPRGTFPGSLTPILLRPSV